jgi:hypothetical protein
MHARGQHLRAHHQGLLEMDTVCRPGQGCHGEIKTTFSQNVDGGNNNVIVGQCSMFALMIFRCEYDG